ncbi:transcriptional regulator, partial [Streptomyces klenkii]
MFGWSLENTAVRIAQAGREIGLNLSADGVQKVWRWENRGVRPDAANQRALARAMGVPEERVRLLHWPQWLPGAETARVAFPWSTQGALEALEALMEDALIDRRGFMTVSGVAVTAAASGWACAEPDRLTASAHGGRLDEETVAWVEDRIPALRKLDDRLSGGSVLRLALADLHMVTELISHSSYSAALGQRLLRTAAELA